MNSPHMLPQLSLSFKIFMQIVQLFITEYLCFQSAALVKIPNVKYLYFAAVAHKPP